MLKFIISALFICVNCTLLRGQNICGYISDEKNIPVFSANIVLKSNPLKGTYTKINGYFEINIAKTLNVDTLIISYLGYKTQFVEINTKILIDTLRIKILPNNKLLNEVVVQSKNNITSEFSIQKIKPIEIYLNPASAGDPLKSVNSSSSSTNTDESVVPALRGSTPNLNKIIFNQVPIDNPSKYSQSSSPGKFSIFNTELIQNVTVYASNPPLTYCNSAGGVIDICTLERNPMNSISASVSLSNIGLLLSHTIKKKSFVQIYSNYEFSKPFLELNKSGFEQVKRFESFDVGINSRIYIDSAQHLNIFNYSIAESSLSSANAFYFTNNAETNSKRNINIVNYKFSRHNNILSANNAISYENNIFSFGNSTTNETKSSLFTSISLKTIYSNYFIIQYGLSNNISSNKFKNKIPIHYFALADSFPFTSIDTSISLGYADAFIYTRLKYSDFIFGFGVKPVYLYVNSDFLFLYQLNSRYFFNSHHSILISGGYYSNQFINKQTYPDVSNTSSYQGSLEYFLDYDNTSFKFASFAKQENYSFNNDYYYYNLTFNKKNILGFELFFEKNFLKYFRYSLSYTYLNAKWDLKEKTILDQQQLPYFIKSYFSFNSDKLFSINLMFSSRTGLYYTPVQSSFFRPDIGVYQPIFNDVNSEKYSNYYKLDLSITKNIYLKKYLITTYLNINNILDNKNQRNIIYNSDYSTTKYEFYDRFSIYFGVMIRLKISDKKME